MTDPNGEIKDCWNCGETYITDDMIDGSCPYCGEHWNDEPDDHAETET